MSIVKKIISIILFLLLFINNVFAELYFSEIMPNTIDDKNLEYLIIHNSGSKRLNLDGYKIKDKANKQFDFGYGDYIEPNQDKKLFRNQTKILLNNTNEEIYLYDNLGNLLDYFSYETSEKGKKIVINKKIIDNQETTNTGELAENNSEDLTTNTGTVQETDNQETTNTGELAENNSEDLTTNSGTVQETDNQETTNTGELAENNSKDLTTNSGTVQETEKQEITNTGELVKNNSEDLITNSGKLENISKIKVLFQNPSYILDKDKEKSEYKCDLKKQECKLNLDLRKTFENLKESNFKCKIDYGLKGWYTGEENKCNPNIIIYPKGEFDLKIQVLSKKENKVLIEKTIKIINPVLPEVVEKEKIIEKEKIVEKIVEKNICKTSKNSIDKKLSKNNKNDFSKENLKSILISSPTVEIQSGIKNGKCTKKNCLVNLIYKQKNKREYCLWNFGQGTFKTKNTNKKCNPGYVYFPTGKHKITLKVYDKYNSSNYKIAYLNFENFDNSKISKNTLSKLNKDKENINRKDNFIDDLSKEKLENNFKKEKVIVKYKKLRKNNDLDNGKIVFKKTIKNNTKKKNRNKINKKLKIKKKHIKVVYFEDSIYNYDYKNNKIIIQGKLGKNKILKGNNLICYDKCSVNFDLKTKNERFIKKIIWDFGNGKKVYKKNPSYIKYTYFGNYNIKLYLEYINGEKETKKFFVSFLKKKKITKIKKHKVKLKTKKKIASKNKNGNKLLSYNAISKDKCKELFPEYYKNNNSSTDKKLKYILYLLLFVIANLLGFILLKKNKII